ncbi:MAG: aminotransferase class I/II-fold pyridoxal phosphate-dependent enzyme, partial [Candidatus Competibacterales bacterium]
VLLDSTPDGWRLDLQRLLDACTPRTKAIYVNTPNNPTGWVMAEDDLRALLDFARKRGLWVIVDEVYRRFIYGDAPPPSILALAEPDDRLIVTHTFSKNWCMTGWRVGWAVIPLDLGGVFENLVQYNTSGTPVFIQRGALAAVAQGDEFLASWVARCHQGRDIVGRALAPLPKVQAPPPAGAFYALLQVEGQGDAMALAKALVDSAQVGLAPGSAFGPGAEGAVRLCFATSHTTLETAMERLVAALG